MVIDDDDLRLLRLAGFTRVSQHISYSGHFDPVQVSARAFTSLQRRRSSGSVATSARSPLAVSRLQRDRSGMKRRSSRTSMRG
jgi:hypothetical protein